MTAVEVILVEPLGKHPLTTATRTLGGQKVSSLEPVKKSLLQRYSTYIAQSILFYIFLFICLQSKKIQILKDQKAKVDRERGKFLEMKRKFQEELMLELEGVSEVKTKRKIKNKH